MALQLNSSDQETLRPKLVPRCAVAVRDFMLYSLGNELTSPERFAWCKDNMTNIASLGEQTSHYVTSEPTFLDSGTSITDAAIKSRVEYVLQNYLGVPV